MKRKMRKLTTANVANQMMLAVQLRHKQKPKSSKTPKNGEMFESIVYCLQNMGFIVQQKGKSYASHRVILKNVFYPSIYHEMKKKYNLLGKNGYQRTEFVLVATDIESTKEFPLVNDGKEKRIRVECKWQSNSGSTYAKVTHSVLDLLYTIPEDRAILLMDGPEWPEYVKCWVKELTEGNIVTLYGKPSDKKIKVMNIDEFVDWANRAFYHI